MLPSVLACVGMEHFDSSYQYQMEFFTAVDVMTKLYIKRLIGLISNCLSMVRKVVKTDLDRVCLFELNISLC